MSTFNVLARVAVPRGLQLLGLDPRDPSPLVQVARHLALDALQLANVALMYRGLRAVARPEAASGGARPSGADAGEDERAPGEEREEARGEAPGAPKGRLPAASPLPLLPWLLEGATTPEMSSGLRAVLLGVLSFPLLECAHRVAASAWAGAETAEAVGGSGGGAALGAPALALWTVVLSFAAPVWEEALFRGMLLSSLKGLTLDAARAGRWVRALARGSASEADAAKGGERAAPRFALVDALAIALSSLAFAFAHGGAPEALSTLFLLGGVLGLVRVASGRIWPAAVVHAAWNLHLLARLWRGE